MCVCVCVQEVVKARYKTHRMCYVYLRNPGNFEGMMHFAAYKIRVYVNQILDI